MSSHAADEGTPVRITVTGIERPAGQLLAGAYADADGWLGPQPAHRLDVPVPATLAGGELAFEMRLPPGRWAISVFQDLDGNRRLDSNFLGIPTEASGSSNNPPARFGPPKFDAALVTVGNEPLALEITLD